MADPAPEGFTVDNFGGPFVEEFGPLYTRVHDDGTITRGLRIDRRHLNLDGVVHGGVMMAFLDCTSGRQIEEAEPGTIHVSTNITTSFLAGPRAGDWLEGRAQITRAGRRLIYVRVVMSVDGKTVMTGETTSLRIGSRKDGANAF